MPPSGTPDSLQAWLNGDWVTMRDARVPLLDRGVFFGDGVTDSLRTFGGRPFAVREHVGRFLRWMEALGIRLGRQAKEVEDIVHRVCERNAPAVHDDGDLWVFLMASRAGEPRREGNPAATFAVVCAPLELADHSRLYGKGRELVTLRGAPRDRLYSMKSMSRLDLVLAELETAQGSADVKPLLVSPSGSLLETSDGNVLLAVNRRIVAPPVDYALDGVSRAVTLRLAIEAGIEVTERRASLHDVRSAQELLVTSSGYCVIPATRVDRAPVGSGVPGPMFRTLLGLWSDHVGLDIQRQAELHAARPNRLS